MTEQVHVTVQARIGAEVFDLGECDLASPRDPQLAALLRAIAEKIENGEHW
jgi:hypothetical protein